MKNKSFLGLAVLALAAGLAFLQPSAASADSQGWPQDRGDPSRTGARSLGGSYGSLRGVVAWRADIAAMSGGGTPMIDSSPVVAPNSSGAGTIYVGTVGGKIKNVSGAQSLVAINPNGTRKWALSLQAEGFTYKVRTAPAVRTDNKRIAVVGYRGAPLPGGGWALKGRLFLVSPEGTIVWNSREFDGVGLSSPLSRFARLYVFAHPGNADDLLREFDTNTFQERWIGGIHYGLTGCNCNLPPPTFDPLPAYNPYFSWNDPDTRLLLPSPSYDSVNSEIVQPSAHTARFSVTGGQVWQRDLAGVTTAVDVGSGSYVGSLDGSSLVRLPRPASMTSWSVYAGSPRAVAKGENHLYVSGRNGYLYSFTTLGQLRWQQAISSIPGQVGAPVVVRGDRELVVVTTKDAVFGFYENGDFAFWPIALDSPALGSPAIADGVLYVATQKSLYAIT